MEMFRKFLLLSLVAVLMVPVAAAWATTPSPAPAEEPALRAPVQPPGETPGGSTRLHPPERLEAAPAAGAQPTIAGPSRGSATRTTPATRLTHSSRSLLEHYCILLC